MQLDVAMCGGPGVVPLRRLREAHSTMTSPADRKEIIDACLMRHSIPTVKLFTVQLQDVVPLSIRDSSK